MYEIDRMIDKHKDPLDPLQTILGVKGTMKCKLSEMLTRHSSQDKHSLSIIADLKRESPTNCSNRPGLSFSNAGEVVETMANTGFDVVFINTDSIAYKGSIDDLKTAISSAHSIGNRTRPAIVMKDIILHPLQLAQAAHLHADGVILNSFYLGPALESMIDISYTLGIEPIVEVHTLEDALYAIQLHTKLLMINQWNRLTNTCHPNRALQLKEIIPDGVISIACGGIKTQSQIEHLGIAGFDAIVLGKKLSDTDIPNFISSIKDWYAPGKGILAMSTNLFFDREWVEGDVDGGGNVLKIKENYKETLKEMNKFYQIPENNCVETPEPKDVLLKFIGNDLPEKWILKKEKWMKDHAHEYPSKDHAEAVYDFNMAVEFNTMLQCNKKLISQNFKKELVDKMEEAISNHVKKCYLNLKQFTNKNKS